ncbi:hypothetical protein ACF1AE_14215 [Streptomyces sp. NPDC014986]|uniref:hypothetical protein n=1 Tax=Streptomyces sp. NPDC014986 TaxID=3364934 RepID=UPI0036F5279F
MRAGAAQLHGAPAAASGGAAVVVRPVAAGGAEDRSRTFRVYADPAGHPFCLCAC